MSTSSISTPRISLQIGAGKAVKPDGALADAMRLRANFVGDQGYAIVYGSHARTSAAVGSDLDLLFVGPPLSPDRLDHLIGAVIALHQNFGLALDVEVAYEVKLLGTAKEIHDAVTLRGFVLDRDGSLTVPEVVAEPSFLNTRSFKLRLILNALTTPHLFLGGRAAWYARHRAAAERAVALLGLSLLDAKPVLTLDDMTEALVVSRSGATGKDFLGYRRDHELLGVLRRGVARLVEDGAVRSVGHGRLVQRPEVRRRLLAIREPAVSRALAEPGTLEVAEGGVEREQQ